MEPEQKGMCVLPSRSGAKLGVRKVGVAGWEVISWMVVGVGGTVVVSDTLSTDRYIHKHYYLRHAVTFEHRKHLR